MNKDTCLLDVIQKLDERERLSESFLSKVLIELDAKGYNLLRIVAGISGLETPRLEKIVDDYVIYRILDKDDSLHVTEGGKKYIDEKVNEIRLDPGYKQFSKFTDIVILKMT